MVDPARRHPGSAERPGRGLSKQPRPATYAGGSAVPFGCIHLPLAFLGEISLASVLISLATYILLGLLLRPLIGIVLRGSRDSLLAAGLMHSVFNRTNNDNGIAAACSTESSTGSESRSQWSYSSPCWRW